MSGCQFGSDEEYPLHPQEEYERVPPKLLQCVDVSKSRAASMWLQRNGILPPVLTDHRSDESWLQCSHNREAGCRFIANVQIHLERTSMLEAILVGLVLILVDKGIDFYKEKRDRKSAPPSQTSEKPDTEAKPDEK